MEEKSVITEELTVSEATIGEQSGNEKVFCVKCGSELSEDQLFCPKCGQKVGEKIEVATKKKLKTPIKVAIGIVIVFAIVVVATLIVRGTQAKSITLNKDSVTIKQGETVTLTYIIDPDNTKDKTVTWSSSNESIAKVNNGIVSGVNEGDCTITITTRNGKTDTCNVVITPAGPDFEAIYNEYCSSTYATVASDGSYLSIDTNPNDKDEYMDYEAYVAIMSVNEALDLPESVLNQMNQTRSLDGMQSYSTDEVLITWTYHPDDGLEVSYSLK